MNDIEQWRAARYGIIVDGEFVAISDADDPRNVESPGARWIGGEHDYQLAQAVAKAVLSKTVAVPVREPMTTVERSVIDDMIELTRVVFLALDDSEEQEGEDGRQHMIDARNFDDVCNALDRLNNLPDDQPGYTMDAGAKAEWALRRLIGANSPAPIASTEAPRVAALAVWYGSMPESNGKTNWTAILHKGDIVSGTTIDRSEYPDRVRYAADRVRWLIGDLEKEPWILDYDADKHSGYAAPPAPIAAVEPIGYFINDAAEGMKPHYSQIDEAFRSNKDVFALYRSFAPIASATETVATDVIDHCWKMYQTGPDIC